MEIERIKKGLGHSIWIPEWFSKRDFIFFEERWFDVVRDKEKVTIYLDVRDLDKDKIEINLTKNYVEIEAKYESDFEEKSFYQKISINEEIDEENADAVIIEGGILKITIPKKEEKKYKVRVR